MLGFLGGLFKSVLPTLVGGLLGGQSKTAGMNGQGVGSMMGQSEPGPMQQNPTGGTQMGGVLKDAFTAGIQSVVGQGASYLGSGISGRANRKYLDEAFPELNPWEKAGATATGAGVGLSGQNVEQEMQKKQLDVQQKMQDKTIDLEKLRIAAGVQMNERSAHATESAAATSAAPIMAQVDALNRMRTSQGNKADVETDYISGKDTREWMTNLSTAMMRGWNYPSGDETWMRKALTALWAQTLGRGIAGTAGAMVKPAPKKAK